MSLERIQEYCGKFARITKILTIITVAVIVCETLCLVWLALIPGKLNTFFNVIRIYAPFTTNINNTALCLFELAVNLTQSLLVFVMLNLLRQMFLRVEKTISLGSVTQHIKSLSIVLMADSVIIPVMKKVSCSIFMNQPVPSGIVDLCPLIMGATLYFIAIIIQSKSVFKDEEQ